MSKTDIITEIPFNEMLTEFMLVDGMENPSIIDILKVLIEDDDDARLAKETRYVKGSGMDKIWAKARDVLAKEIAKNA